MAKQTVVYLCRACGASHPKWLGKCPDCGAWDSLERYAAPKEDAAPAGFAGPAGAVETERVARPLEEISTLDVPREESGVGELDRVLGGGFVPGSVTLVGGDPGIGKSTLLLQVAARMADRGRSVLYVSSEESAAQVKLRAERVLAEADGATERRRHLFVLSETSLPRIVEQSRRVRPALLVVDSVQMLWTSGVEAAPGSVAQLRRACLELVALAKQSGAAIALVGHVTKEGELAGPKLLEHLVDAVLQFEGDRHHAQRVVRAVKNRFGSTQEIGLFEMTGGGLAEVREGSLSLDADAEPRPGSVCAPTIAGSRCLLAEVQALTATSILGAAKRRASGLDGNRLAMLIAVLEKHGGLRLGDQDVFAQAAGGLRVVEPATDLAVSLAIAGAHYGRVPPAGFAAIGEVGLTGEIRPVRGLEQRVAETVRRGGRTIAVPASQEAGAAAAARQSGAARPAIVGVGTISAALDLLAVGGPGPAGRSVRKVASPS